ncbi:unnamed protein product [Blepharisma stoltei]|uniref:Ion transport domain-containing protein n=1 Tax=Blepharisma stoltei TaxID=1481888 RepID=A0AAU9JEE0_9CILI|nr:unnamed protein product [Blepharisma stoltei]
MRGITYFRIFKNTRYMVNLITQVIKDITSFFILLFYSTLAFAFIFLVMDKDDPKLIDYIKISYRLDLGDFDPTGFTSMQWVCLFLATMINMIIMLNLLISIMGDTFGKVQENAEIADRKELLGMISEIETLMFWKKSCTEKSYFQVLTGEESEETEKNIKKFIKKNIKRYHLQTLKMMESHGEMLESHGEMLKKIWTKLEGDKKEGDKKEGDKKEEDKKEEKVEESSNEKSGEESGEKSGEEED